MGPEVLAAAPYIFGAASTGLSLMAQQKQEKRQQSIADQMTAYKLSKARETEAATNKFLDTQVPEARAATTAAAQQEIAHSLDQSIGAAQAFEKPETFAGKVSPDYTSRKAANDATLSTRLRSIVNNLSTMGAPARRDFDTQLKLGQASGDVASANSAVNSVSPYFDREFERVGKEGPDPFLDFASQLAAGVGVGLAGRKKAPTGTGTAPPINMNVA